MKNPTIWVVSDTHIDTVDNPSGIVRRGIRPPNHTALTREGLKRIREIDILIHLGDVLDKEEGQLAEFMAQCPARTKYLCLGNHDNHSIHWYLNRGFDAVMESYTLKYGGKHILFSHVPMMVRRWDRPWKGRRGVVLPVDGIDLNIHGHLHLRNHRDEESAWQDEADEAWFLVSHEALGYCPVKLDDILNGKVPRVLKRDAMKYVYAPERVHFDPIPKK